MTHASRFAFHLSLAMGTSLVAAACAAATVTSSKATVEPASVARSASEQGPQAQPAEDLASAEGPASAGDTESLATRAQNPLATMISLPLQNNTDFGVGPEGAAVNTLNIQPVWPVALNDEWNMITRTILPVVYQGETVPGIGSEFGLGDTTFTAFFSPAKPQRWTWGVGPMVLLPTSTDARLGAGEWGAGVNAVALTMPKPWVIGALLGNLWSFDGSVNSLTFQPFINYNLADGWYLNSVPIVTANWEAPSGEQWKVPIGAGVGKVMRFGKQPVNLQVGYYNFVESPTNGPEWQLRVQLQLLFPK